MEQRRAYEALNLADGRRTPEQIAATLSFEFGTIPLPLVREYLQSLQRVGIVE